MSWQPRTRNSGTRGRVPLARWVPVTFVAVAATASVAGCGGGSATISLPTVAASPAQTPTPPATSAPVTAATSTATGATATRATVATPTAATAATTPGAPSDTTSEPVRSGPALSACAHLRLTLTADRSSYSASEPVRLTARLTNAGVACTFLSGPDTGFSLATGGQAVWSSGCGSSTGGQAGSFCPQFRTVTRLSPGQTISREQVWDQERQAAGSGSSGSGTAARGAYTATETWAGVTATTTLRLT